MHGAFIIKSQVISPKNKGPIVVEIKLPNDLQNSEIQWHAKIFTVENVRDQIVFAQGDQLRGSGQEYHEIKIGPLTKLTAGLYRLEFFISKTKENNTEQNSDIVLLSPDNLADKRQYILITNRHDGDRQLDLILKSVCDLRKKYIASELIAPPSDRAGPPLHFQAAVFFEGIWIPTELQFKGFCLQPLKQGRSYGEIYSIVSDFIRDYWQVQIPFSDKWDMQHREATQVGVCIFYNVLAYDRNEALYFVENYARNVLNIIGFERGAKAKIVSSISCNETGSAHRFLLPRYQGNEVIPIDLNSIGSFVDQAIRKQEDSPQISLLLSLFVNALEKPHRDFRTFRYISCIEVFLNAHFGSKEFLLYDNEGNYVRHFNEEVATTKSLRGKIYWYLFENRYGPFELKSGDKIFFVNYNNPRKDCIQAKSFSLWSALRVLTNVRDQVAHEGRVDFDGKQFNKDAVTAALLFHLYRERYCPLLTFLEQIAHRMICDEFSR